MDHRQHVRQVVRRIDRPILIAWAVAALGILPAVALMVLADLDIAACVFAPVLFFGCVACGVMISWNRRANVRAVVTGHCAVCGYDLSRLGGHSQITAKTTDTPVTCPECGMVNSEEHLQELIRALDE